MSTKYKSEYLNNKWLEWLLETGMSSIDTLMYDHWATNVACECSVCTAFHHTASEDDDK